MLIIGRKSKKIMNIYHFEGERRFGGDRDGYRGGPRGGPGGDFGGDKGGAPADYRPSFGVILLPLHLLLIVCLIICVFD